MGGGAHDLVVEQASQPPYALGKEGRELAVACSACLRSHLAQLGSFRIESYSWHGRSTIRFLGKSLLFEKPSTPITPRILAPSSPICSTLLSQSIESQLRFSSPKPECNR